MFKTPVAVLRTVFAVVVQSTATLVIGTYFIVVVRLRPKTRQIRPLLRFWARLFLLVTGTRVEIEGVERIDPNGSYVFVGNHSSNLDIPVLLGKLPVSVRFLAKKEMFTVPVLGKAMRSIHMVETDRRPSKAAHRAINEQVTEVIAASLSLMIFPEGTRSDSGEMLPFKKGAFRLAVDNLMPVVPVTIVGTGEAWKPHAKLIHGGKVRLIVHDPIPTQGLTSTDLSNLRDQARHVVASST